MISASNALLQQQSENTLLKSDCQQLVNFKNAIWTWGHFRKMICNKLCFKLGKNATETYGIFQTVLDHLAWIEHQFLSGIRDSRESRSLWGRMRRVGEVRKSIHQIGLAKWLGLGLLCWRLTGVQEEIPSEEPSTLQIGSVAFQPGQCTSPQSILVTDYLTKMGIKTVAYPS